MHKIIIPGVHEIAALVAKIAFVKFLGINRLYVQMLRIFNKTRYNLHQVARYDYTFGENSSSRERSDYSPESAAIRDYLR